MAVTSSVVATDPGVWVLGAPDPILHGVDVSNHQGVIDWAKMAGKGVKFAYIKVTEGTNYIDPMWQRNRSEARRNGVLVGPYHYVRLDHGDSQGEIFLEEMKKASGWDLPPALDCEDESEPDMIRTEVARKLLVIADLCVAGVIYTNVDWWSRRVGDRAPWARTLRLWVANWDVPSPAIPLPWRTWDIWQYAVDPVGREYGCESMYLDLDQMPADKLLSIMGASGPRCPDANISG